MRVPGLHRGSPSDDRPATDGPATDGPATDGPATDGPATDGPGRPAVVPGPAVVDPAALADAVSAAVLAVPGVLALHPGALGTVATYLPGRRVVGVRLGPGGDGVRSGSRAEVHVVLAEGADVLRTAARVHAAAEPLVGGPVHVHVEDYVALEAVSPSPPPLEP